MSVVTFPAGTGSSAACVPTPTPTLRPHALRAQSLGSADEIVSLTLITSTEC